MMMIHHILVLEKIFMKGWDDSTILNCIFTKWVVVGVGLAKYIEYIWLLCFDNLQPRALFNQVVFDCHKGHKREIPLT